MQPQNPPPKSLSQIVDEFKEDIQASELMDILEAMRTLKRGSGYGRVELFYLDKVIDTIEINIKRKPKAKK